MTPPAPKAPSTSRSKLAGTIKSARDIMRKDAGLNGDLDRLPQLSWLLFLKAFDERVEKVGAALNPSYRPAIDDKYAWDTWAGNPDFTGPDLLTFVDDDLLPYLRELAGEGPNDPRNVISTVFKEIHNRMLSGVLLRDLVNTVDSIGFESSDDIHTMAFVYESILKEMRDAAGDSGEFYTPRPVIRFMVQQSFLKLGEAILDPACGTGGFLAQAYEDLQPLADSTVKRAELHHTLRGIEKKSLPYLLGSMNLLLHGIETPRLVRDNALIRMRTENQPAHRVNVVVTNPPFGGEEEESVVKLFPKPFQTQETAWLFVYSILDMLKRSGRCAIVLPNGSLFGGGVGARVKEKLLKECNLHTIVRLPQGVFAPYTQIPANLLFFEKTGPTRDIWFYEIPTPDGRRGYTKTKPIRFEEFDDCVLWWGGRDRQGREEGERSWKVPVDSVKTNGFNLDIANPHVGDRLAHHPPRELTNGFICAQEEALELAQVLRSEVAASNEVFQRIKEIVPLGEGIRIDIDEIPVISDDLYKIAGVYGFGRGLIDRGQILGTETSYKRFHRLHAGTLIVSRLKAFEGALAVIPPEFEGACTSPEFPTFSVIEERMDIGYLGHLCRWPVFWSRLSRESQGVGARRERVSVERLLTLEIPLPALNDQRLISSLLDRISDSWQALERQRHWLESLQASLLDAVFSQTPRGTRVSRTPRKL